jgi:hypothetical protein
MRARKTSGHAKNQVRIVAIPTRDHITAAFNDGTILQGFELCLLPSIRLLDVADLSAQKKSYCEKPMVKRSPGHEVPPCQGVNGGQRPILATAQPSQSRLASNRLDGNQR